MFSVLASAALVRPLSSIWARILKNDGFFVVALSTARALRCLSSVAFMEFSSASKRAQESTSARSITMLDQCSAMLKGLLIIRPGAYVGPQPIEFLRAEHAVPRGHLALALLGSLVETRPFVGAQPPQVEDRAGAHQSFSVARRAVGLVELRAGFDRRAVLRRCALRSRQRAENGADSHPHAYGRAKTKIELCPRTALGMDFCVSPSGPAVTDWPSPVNTITYSLPFTAYLMVLAMTMPPTTP